MNFIFLLYPVLSLVYSVCLTKFDMFSVSLRFAGRAGEIDSDEQLRRFESILNERANMVDQRQQQFDEQNFG